jgi:4-alpha-glucanotransferase
VAFHTFLQVTFFKQWHALKAYANEKGIKLIGDIPIYVSPDSVEVFANPKLFQLDKKNVPSSVAGVPPDAFSAVGQLWGNPLYNWKGKRKEVFDWWKSRVEWAATLYDVVRIDHFRGFHTYWSIPAVATDAREGKWILGPGQKLVDFLRNEIPDLEYIAEDLGDLDEAALSFVRKSGLPGMKILCYAFDTAAESAYLPYNCEPDSVIYTGTHDTPTFLQWLYEEATEEQRRWVIDYLRLREDEGYGWGVIAGAWAAPSKLAIAPFQDVLGLGGDARVNLPGTTGPHNWSWRVRREAFNSEVSSRLRHLTRIYRRCL